MTKDNKTIDSLDPVMCDYPFVREGMTLDEYYEEKEYYIKQSVDDLKKGRYVPLWKQREGILPIHDDFPKCDFCIHFERYTEKGVVCKAFPEGSPDSFDIYGEWDAECANGYHVEE
ncbi:MAG: hypothetical protein K6G42_10365 [Lachnospiraceae bacterium]|nr:hypothetical protein [Lachnospiraceae bacterium]